MEGCLASAAAKRVINHSLLACLRRRLRGAMLQENKKKKNLGGLGMQKTRVHCDIQLWDPIWHDTDKK